MSNEVGSIADLMMRGSKRLSIPDIEVKDSIVSAESAAHIEAIQKEAVANREHYLAVSKQTGKPWFRCLKKEIQYSEFIMLTRDMAEDLKKDLWSVTDGNRKVKRLHVEALQRDIEAGRWLPTHESIAIDVNGQTNDGQHRLTAFLNSSKSEVCFYITFNVLPEAKFAVDSGSKRTTGEKLSMIVDRKWGSKVTGFCRAIMRGINAKVRYTDAEIAEFATTWEPVVEWVMNHCPKAAAEIQAAIAKMYIFYGPDLIVDFCDRLKNVRFVEEGDPAKALYVQVDRIKGAPDLKKYRLTLSALNALVNNKKVKVLREIDGDIFEWDRGRSNREWNAPRESWYVKVGTAQV